MPSGLDTRIGTAGSVATPQLQALWFDPELRLFPVWSVYPSGFLPLSKNMLVHGRTLGVNGYSSAGVSSMLCSYFVPSVPRVDSGPTVGPDKDKALTEIV